MTNYHCSIENGSKNKGNLSINKYLYLTKKDANNRNLLIFRSGNMPKWTNNDPYFFWKNLDKYERSNSRLYKEIKFLLPSLLSLEDNKNLVDKLCDNLLDNRFPFSYSIYEKIDDKGNLLNIYADIIFNQRINDEIERNVENHFKRFNKNNPELGGARKDTISNTKKWLNNVRTEIANLINLFLNENSINEQVSEKSYREVNIPKIPQIYVDRKSFLNYKKNNEITQEIAIYLQIRADNEKLFALTTQKNALEKKINNLHSKVNHMNTLDFLVKEKRIDYDILRNIDAHINNEGKLLFKLNLYGNHLNYSKKIQTEIIYYKILNNSLMPEFDADYFKNKNILGIYTAELNGINNQSTDQKVRITITNTPIDILYLASIDKFIVKDFFNCKNIYIATFSNINNIEELNTYLLINQYTKKTKDLYISFKNERDSFFVNSLQSNTKVSDNFWFKIKKNKLATWEDELSLELNKINRIYSSLEISKFDSINKHTLMKTLYPEFHKNDQNFYVNSTDQIIYISPNGKTAKFNNNLEINGSINFCMKLSKCNYITACKLISKAIKNN